MKVLIITNLFPNHLQPQRGIFNKQQFVELAKLCELKVVAPLPWYPKFLTNTKRSVYAEIKNEEKIDNIEVYHPRYFLTPKIGRSLYGILFYFGIISTVKRIYKDFPFDMILATWAYPDAFASSLVAEVFHKPLVIRVHGTDINITSHFYLQKKMINYAFQRAQAIIAVSSSLKERIKELGIQDEKVVVINNGINRNFFKKMDRKLCREKLGLSQDSKSVLFVGNLEPIKGIGFLIDAFKSLNGGVCLNIIGDGDLKEILDQKIKSLNLSQRIILRGKIAHEEIPYWLNASDVLCLPSLNEGCPNVVVEALACGVPVLASRVGASVDLINEHNGCLVKPKDVKAITKGINFLLERKDKKFFVFKESSILSWEENALRVFSLLKKACEK